MVWLKSNRYIAALRFEHLVRRPVQKKTCAHGLGLSTHEKAFLGLRQKTIDNQCLVVKAKFPIM
jgi:hypothetical protein